MEPRAEPGVRRSRRRSGLVWLVIGLATAVSGVYLTISISYPAALGGSWARHRRCSLAGGAARTERATSKPAAHGCANLAFVEHVYDRVGQTADAPGYWHCRRCGERRYTAPVSAARRSTPPGRTCCVSSGATTDPDPDGRVPIGATQVRRRRDRRQGVAVCVRGPLPTALPPCAWSAVATESWWDRRVQGHGRAVQRVAGDSVPSRELVHLPSRAVSRETRGSQSSRTKGARRRPCCRARSVARLARSRLKIVPTRCGTPRPGGPVEVAGRPGAVPHS